MKKIITCAFLVLLLTRSLFSIAQRENSSWISASFGLNSSWILNQNAYGNQELEYSPKFCFSGGASYKYYLHGYGYSLGLGIGNLGENYAGEMAGAEATRKVNLTYVMLPIMGMYDLGGYPQHKWLSFGPQFMYLLSAQQTFTRLSGGRSIANPEMMMLGNTDVIKRFNPVDVMLAFDISNIYELQVSDKIRSLLSFYGAVGLTDINRKDYRMPNIHMVYGGSHNLYIGIHVGIMYNLKEK